MCLGSTDLPLSRLGRLQAAALGRALRNKELSVFSSPLVRARSTAEALGRSVTVLPGLRELDAGLWDGLSFDEIRQRFPELYKKRGENPALLPPGAESPEDGLRRFRAALSEALARCSGEAAIVCHKGILRQFLGTGTELPYCSVSTAEYESGKFSDLHFYGRPVPAMTRELALKLLDASGCGEKVTAHSLAVEKKALELGRGVIKSGGSTDLELLSCAAILHDIARDEPRHPRRGEYYINSLGYPEAACIIGQHNDYSGTELSEAALLFLADKLTQEDRFVNLQQRFGESFKKCSSPKARQKHEERFRQADFLFRRYTELTGTEP